MSEWTSVSKEDARKLCLGMYVGTKCSICKYEYKSIKDIEERELTCCGNNGVEMSFACKKCYAVSLEEVKK